MRRQGQASDCAARPAGTSTPPSAAARSRRPRRRERAGGDYATQSAVAIAALDVTPRPLLSDWRKPRVSVRALSARKRPDSPSGSSLRDAHSPSPGTDDRPLQLSDTGTRSAAEAPPPPVGGLSWTGCGGRGPGNGGEEALFIEQGGGWGRSGLSVLHPLSLIVHYIGLGRLQLSTSVPPSMPRSGRQGVLGLVVPQVALAWKPLSPEFLLPVSEDPPSLPPYMEADLIGSLSHRLAPRSDTCNPLYLAAEDFRVIFALVDM